MNSSFKERLTTSDESGKRIYVYPASVRGFFKTRKNLVHFIFLVIFLVVPWIKIHGKNIILLDIEHRQFVIFGQTFWAHEVPLLALVAFCFLITIGLVTAIWGRVWCGWACPQTVFTDFIFRKIEGWIEGDHLASKKLDQGPLNADKFLKKTTKWFIFLVITLIISHSFVAYFIGLEKLHQIMQQSPSENIGTFLFAISFSLLLLFDFGWFREQFCTVVCPYGRFQSILLDEGSLVISYQQKRGEPRGPLQKDSSPYGDCIDCKKCVTVCPTGIDIRDGLQMECVACTACIDACNQVMKKIGKKPDLIKYEKTGSFLRTRVVVFFTIFIFGFSTLFFLISSRKELEVEFFRSKEQPYQVVEKSGEKFVVNHYRFEALNKSENTLSVQLKPVSQEKVEIISPSFPLSLEHGTQKTVDFFIFAPLKVFNEGRSSLLIDVIAGEKSFSSEELILVGPFLKQ